VLEWVQVVVVDHSDPVLLWFCLGTFFGPDAVHAQYVHKMASVGCSVILPVASDKHPVLARDTAFLRQLVMANGKFMQRSRRHKT